MSLHTTPNSGAVRRGCNRWRADRQQQTPATLAVYLVLYTHEIQLQFVLVSCLAWWHRGNELTSFPEEPIYLRYLPLCENCAQYGNHQ